MKGNRLSPLRRRKRACAWWPGHPSVQHALAPALALNSYCRTTSWRSPRQLSIFVHAQYLVVLFDNSLDHRIGTKSLAHKPPTEVPKISARFR